MLTNRCENCRFWDSETDERGNFPHGLCRAHAPQADRLWPVTEGHDWCGEHEPIEGEEQPDQTLDSDGPDRDDDAL